MRKFALVLALLSATVTASEAQTQKGGLMLGANLATIGSTIIPHESGASTFTINPSVGYFVKNNLVLGAHLTTGFGVGHSGGSTIQYGLQPFVRPYFSKTESRGKMFGEAMLGIAGYVVTGDSYRNTRNFGTASLGAGFAYFITRNVSLESILRVSAQTSITGIDMAYFPSANFGFQIYLNPKTDKWTPDTEKH